MDTSKAITHIGLCAGYGGIELGVKRVVPTLRTVAFCEIEAFACANLVAKMESGLMDPAPIWTDLKTFPWEEFRDRVDVLTGGYPCQPFSAAGRRLGSEDPRHLWPYIASGICILRPKLCFFENVEGHVSLGLSTVISDLEGLGYAVSWGIFSAAECGAPHQRKRVFVMAYGIGAGLEGHAWDGAGVGGLGWSEAESAGPVASGGVWPSRPGQQQFPWEPPRVVGNTGGNGRWEDQQGREAEERVAFDWSSEGLGNSNSFNGSTPTAGWQHDAETGCASSRQAKPQMGGDADGVACGMGDAGLYSACDNRIDELRLLGNGVVPATAEKAFSMLFSELKKQKPKTKQ